MKWNAVPGDVKDFVKVSLWPRKGGPKIEAHTEWPPSWATSARVNCWGGEWVWRQQDKRDGSVFLGLHFPTWGPISWWWWWGLTVLLIHSWGQFNFIVSMWFWCVNIIESSSQIQSFLIRWDGRGGTNEELSRQNKSRKSLGLQGGSAVGTWESSALIGILLYFHFPSPCPVAPLSQNIKVMFGSWKMVRIAPAPPPWH